MKWIVALGFIGGILLLLASHSHGDTTKGPVLMPPPPSTNPVASYAGSSARHEPFTSYDPGPADSLWTYDKLSSQEKADMDALRADNHWAAINATSDPIVQEDADAAAANSAQHQLGLEDTAMMGVVQ